MVLPKNWVNTSFITSSMSSGESRLHAMPSTVRLYFFLKSRFTSSSKRKRWRRYCCIMSKSQRRVFRACSIGFASVYYFAAPV